MYRPLKSPRGAEVLGSASAQTSLRRLELPWSGPVEETPAAVLAEQLLDLLLAPLIPPTPWSMPVSRNDRSGILPVCRLIKALTKILRLNADVRSWRERGFAAQSHLRFLAISACIAQDPATRKSEISRYLPVRSDEERDP